MTAQSIAPLSPYQFVGRMAAAQGIAALAAILLARVYSPASFGQLAAYAGWVTAIGAVATLRLDIEVLRAASEVAAAEVESRGTRYALLAGAIAGALAWAISFRDRGWWLAACVAVGTTLAGMIPLAQARLVRRNALDEVGRARVRQSLSQVAVQAAASPLHSAGGLVGGDLCGRLVMLIGLRRTRHRVGSDLAEAIPVESAQATGMLAVATLLAGFALSLPLIAMPLSAGDIWGGHFGIALRTVGLPLALVGHPLGQVLVARAIQGTRDLSSSRGVTRDILVVLAIGGGALAAVTALIGPWLVPLVLGERWTDAGLMVAPLGIAAGTQLIAVPISQLLSLRGRYRTVFRWELLRTGATVIVTALLVRDVLGPLEYCYVLAGVWTACYGLLTVLTLRDSKGVEGSLPPP